MGLRARANERMRDLNQADVVAQDSAEHRFSGEEARSGFLTWDLSAVSRQPSAPGLRPSANGQRPTASSSSARRSGTFGLRPNVVYRLMFSDIPPQGVVRT